MNLLQELLHLSEGWMTVKGNLERIGPYTVDLVKNYQGKHSVEYYAVIFTGANRRVKDELVYQGDPSQAGINDLIEKSKSFLKKYCEENSIH